MIVRPGEALDVSKLELKPGDAIIVTVSSELLGAINPSDVRAHMERLQANVKKSLSGLTNTVIVTIEGMSISAMPKLDAIRALGLLDEGTN